MPEYELINETTRENRKGFVIFLNPSLICKIASQIIYPEMRQFKKSVIRLTPEGIYVSRFLLDDYNQQVTTKTFISDFEAKGDFANQIAAEIDMIARGTYGQTYIDAKARRGLKSKELEL